MKSREASTPGRWLAVAAGVAVLILVIASAAVLELVQRAREGVRVPRGVVTGRARAALDPRGAFAMNAVRFSTRPIIVRADAESAAVAIAYWFAPTRLVFRGRETVERPAVRRHVCGQSYYVRSVVAVPESLPEKPVTSSVVSAWGAAWVIPVCDDAGFVRTTALVGDGATRLRVVLGDQPGDVPELVFPQDGSGYVNSVPQQLLSDFDRGMALSPEAAAAVVAARVRQSGALIAAVPEAFRIVLPRHASDRMGGAITNSPACPRWRITLDRAVALRGVSSGQLVRTRTLYVARGSAGCTGVPMVQIPRTLQPASLGYAFGVRSGLPLDSIVSRLEGRSAELSPLSYRTTPLRVTEPIWFEEAILVRDTSRPNGSLVQFFKRR